jgi:hypothetical protein
VGGSQSVRERDRYEGPFLLVLVSRHLLQFASVFILENWHH